MRMLVAGSVYTEPSANRAKLYCQPRSEIPITTKIT